MKCEHCGAHTCDRCKVPLGLNSGEPFRLPPPFGSLNAAAPREVCVKCYRDYAALGWEWIGEDAPDLSNWP